MNKEVIQKWFDKYPKLETFICAGTISLKMAREILEVDRWFMNDMFKELVMAGAVRSSGSNSWRATPELREWLNERRKQHEDDQSNHSV